MRRPPKKLSTRRSLVWSMGTSGGDFIFSSLKKIIMWDSLMKPSSKFGVQWCSGSVYVVLLGLVQDDFYCFQEFMAHNKTAVFWPWYFGDTRGDGLLTICLFIRYSWKLQVCKELCVSVIVRGMSLAVWSVLTYNLKVYGRWLDTRDQMRISWYDGPSLNLSSQAFWIWGSVWYLTRQQEEDQILTQERARLATGCWSLSHTPLNDAIYNNVFLQGLEWYCAEALYAFVFVNFILALLVRLGTQMAQAQVVPLSRDPGLPNYENAGVAMRLLLERVILDQTVLLISLEVFFYIY